MQDEITFSINQLERESLGEQIAAELRRLIVKGVLSPGTHIKEAQIAESLHISRAPVREAINQLLSEQILERQPYKGVFVYIPTDEDWEQLFDARFVIESHAIDELTRSQDKNVLKKMSGLIKKIQQESRRKNCDWVRLMEADLSFHESLCTGCKNRFLLDMWKNILLKQRIIFMMDCTNGGRINIIAEEHVQIFQTICDGDASLAKKLLKEHIKDSAVSFPKKDEGAIDRNSCV